MLFRSDWDHGRLYSLKGQIVRSGIEQITGLTMPIFEKRRMQHGAAAPAAFSTLFPVGEQPYRRAFLDLYAQ